MFHAGDVVGATTKNLTSLSVTLSVPKGGFTLRPSSTKTSHEIMLRQRSPQYRTVTVNMNWG